MSGTLKQGKLDLAGRRILIVEDDHGLSDWLVRIFGRFGNPEFVVAASGESFRRALACQGPFDLVMVDTDFPEGEEAALHNQEMEKRREAIASELEKLGSFDENNFEDPRLEKVMRLRFELDQLRSAIYREIKFDLGLEIMQQWAESEGRDQKTVFLIMDSSIGCNNRQELPNKNPWMENVQHPWRSLERPSTVEQFEVAIAELLSDGE